MFFHQWIVSNTHICVCQRSNLQSELNASYEAIKKQFSHRNHQISQAFDCGGRLRNLRVDCFNEGLHCVTATWQQVFKGLLQVTGAGVLPHLTVECIHMFGSKCSETVNADGGKPCSFHTVWKEAWEKNEHCCQQNATDSYRNLWNFVVVWKG